MEKVWQPKVDKAGCLTFITFDTPQIQVYVQKHQQKPVDTIYCPYRVKNNNNDCEIGNLTIWRKNIKHQQHDAYNDYNVLPPS